MNPSSITFIRRLIADASAIRLDAGKDYLIETRLWPVVRRAGLRSVDDLVHQLRISPHDPLHQDVLDALTTNETFFFRDKIPFQTLRDVILPDLFARRTPLQQLKIWSAGCSSGQEIYSVAMLLREHFSRFADWRPQLLGTDVSAEVLKRARLGRFTQLEIERGLPALLRKKYFQRVADSWQLDDSIRRMVEFRQFNLNGDWPSLPKMDVILLRNVLVYFDLAAAKSVLHRLRDILQPDGYLLLGGTESALHFDDAFQAVRGDGFSYYRLAQAAALPRPSEPSG